jgi:methyltransferase family protein
MRRFQQRFQLSPKTTVLDVGGTAFNWSLLQDTPEPILLNLTFSGSDDDDEVRIIADGRHLPFRDEAFHVVYSNSMIEHLGSWENQKAFALECNRVGNAYYVQTPNKHFAVEPHLITPFIHWLPRRLQSHLLRRFTIWGLIAKPTPQYCEALLDELRLLTYSDFRRLFPDAEIEREKVLLFTKSFIALKV